MSTICLAYMKPSVIFPALYKLDVIVHVCNLSTQKVEAGGSRVQGHFQLHSELEDSLGYLRPCLNEQK